MSKVKITQEQAEELKQLIFDDWNKEEIIYLTRVGHWREGTPLHGLSADDVAMAYFVGYEVEPNFKVGDWVVITSVNNTGKISKITNTNALKDYPIGLDWDNENEVLGYDDIRHAAPEEVATEKTRGWWDRSGRKVWELREGDLLIGLVTGCFKEVKLVNDSGCPMFSSSNTFQTLHGVKRSHEVVCFAEDRKDI